MVFVLLLGCVSLLVLKNFGTSFSWYWFFPFFLWSLQNRSYFLFHFWCVDGKGRACLFFFYGGAFWLRLGRAGGLGESRPGWFSRSSRVSVSNIPVLRIYKILNTTGGYHSHACPALRLCSCVLNSKGEEKILWEGPSRPDQPVPVRAMEK